CPYRGSVSRRRCAGRLSVLWRATGRTSQRKGVAAAHTGRGGRGSSRGYLPRAVVVGGADRLRDAVGVREDPVAPRLPVVVRVDFPPKDAAVPVPSEPADREDSIQ